MSAAILTAGLHYLAVIVMAGTAFTELHLLKLLPSLENLRLIARVDRLYGIAALAVLASGAARIPLAHGGKGLSYYLHNGAFHGALTLFVIAAVISLLPTLRYLRWNRAASGGQLPTPADYSRLRRLVHVQLTLIVLIALLMPWMARGGL